MATRLGKIHYRCHTLLECGHEIIATWIILPYEGGSLYCTECEDILEVIYNEGDIVRL